MVLELEVHQLLQHHTSVEKILYQANPGHIFQVDLLLLYCIQSPAAQPICPLNRCFKHLLLEQCTIDKSSPEWIVFQWIENSAHLGFIGIEGHDTVPNFPIYCNWFGNHIGNLVLVFKLLKVGWFWVPCCNLHSPTYSRNSSWILEFQVNSSFVSVSLITHLFP